jgi:chaperone modulatory protein CbpM
MIIDLTEAAWLDENHEVTLEELAQVSGLSPDELENLVACGALTPHTREQQPTFTASCLVTIRTAGRLREALEFGADALPVTLLLLERIRELQLQLAQARLPHIPTHRP